MKVLFINNTDSNQYVDTQGKGDPTHIKVLGSRLRVTLDIPNDEILKKLQSEFTNKLTIRKLSDM